MILSFILLYMSTSDYPANVMQRQYKETTELLRVVPPIFELVFGSHFPPEKNFAESSWRDLNLVESIGKLLDRFSE